MTQTHDAIFKALGDPTRRALLERLLSQGEQSVAALTGEAGVSQPAVSKHLGILRDAGLVECRKDGRETRYRARPGGLRPMFDWLGLYAEFWEDRFAALSELLNRMDQ